uniref:Uncharacterized protein n=1 Tax=Amphimedon queenslandica TaxID=400682 RepID=A0A1X7UBD5_AMPQE
IALSIMFIGLTMAQLVVIFVTIMATIRRSMLVSISIMNCEIIECCV